MVHDAPSTMLYHWDEFDIFKQTFYIIFILFSIALTLLPEQTTVACNKLISTVDSSVTTHA